MLISEQAALRWLQIENLSQIHAKPQAYTGTQGTRSQNMLDHDKLEKNIKFPIYEIFSVFFFHSVSVKYDYKCCHNHQNVPNCRCHSRESGHDLQNIIVEDIWICHPTEPRHFKSLFLKWKVTVVDTVTKIRTFTSKIINSHTKCLFYTCLLLSGMIVLNFFYILVLSFKYGLNI